MNYYICSKPVYGIKEKTAIQLESGTYYGDFIFADLAGITYEQACIAVRELEESYVGINVVIMSEDELMVSSILES